MRTKVYVFLFAFVFLPFFVFAQETLTITTYYPSPYGSYNQLSVASNTYLAYSTGSVGIGTTGPVSKLHIHGNYNNDGTGGFALDATDTGNPEKYILRINPFVAGAGKVGYQFQTKSDTGGINIPLTFDNAGNVGIGTVSPQAKLDLGNNWMTPAQSVVADTNVGITWYTPSPTAYGIYRTGGAWTASTYQQLRINWDTGIQLGAGTGVGTGYDKSYVEIVNGKGLMVTSGNVGIGTVSPNASLEIGGNPSSAIRTAYLNISANNGGITDRPYIRGMTDHIVIVPGGTGNAGTKTMYLTYPEGSGSFQTRIQEALFINTSNNVSIGTASTSYKFQVYIDASNEGHTDATGGWARSSDIRVKKNVSDLKDGLARVLKLRPVRYDSKTESNSPKNRGRHTGFIGQEFEKVIPELVSTDGKGYKAIAYGDLTPFLAEAIQEQQKLIEEQAQVNASMRKELDEIKALLKRRSS